MIHDILSKYEFLFNGTLSTCKYKPIYVELHPDSNPCHAKLYPFPRAHKSIFYLKIVKALTTMVTSKGSWIRVGIPHLYQNKKIMEGSDSCLILEN